MACAACSAGKRRNAQGASSAETVACEACAAGRAQEAEGQLECDACAAGQHQPSQGQPECAECLAGQHQQQAQQPKCDDCPVHTFTDTAGWQTSCKKCAQGKFSSPGAQSCDGLTCGTGHYLEGNACAKCAAGRFQPEKNHTSGACTPCATNGFQDVGGQASCKECDVTAFTNGNGSTSCEPVVCKMVGQRVREHACANCDGGQFHASDFHKDQTCATCALGTFSAAGSASCDLSCPAGKYQAAEGSLDCDACAPGQYRAKSDGIVCKQCAAHQHGDTARPPTSASYCVACAAGRVQPARGQLQCEGCAPGRWMEASSAGRECQPCAYGQYQSSWNATRCSNCTAGYTCGLGSTSPTQQPCDEGAFCPEGGFAPKPVPAGMYVKADDNATLVPCERGFYCAGGARTPCQAGYECDEEGLSTQRACSEGFYCPGVTPESTLLLESTFTETKFKCEEGFSCTGGKEQAPCAKGQVSNSSTGNCVTCGDKKFAHRTSNECKPCPGTETEGFLCKDGKVEVLDDFFVVSSENAAVQLAQLAVAGGGGGVGVGVGIGVGAAVKCAFKGACRTVWHAANDTVRTECQGGTTGVLCGTCIDNYARQKNECVECPPSNTRLSALMVMGAALFALLYWKCVKRSLKQGEANHKGKNVSSTCLKLLLTFVYNSALLSSYDLDWGSSLRVLFDAGEASSSGDVSKIGNTGCAGITTPFKIRAMLVALCALPLCALLPPLAAALRQRFCADKAGQGQRALSLSGLRMAGGTHWVTVYHNSVAIGFWLLYPAVLRECAAFLTTQQVGADAYVSSDLSIKVGSPEHGATHALVLLLMGTFVPGVPLLVFGRMWLNRRRLCTEDAQLEMPVELRQQLFFWYSSYKPQYCE